MTCGNAFTCCIDTTFLNVFWTCAFSWTCLGNSLDCLVNKLISLVILWTRQGDSLKSCRFRIFLRTSSLFLVANSVLQAFLAPNNSIHALLIPIYMLILAPNYFTIIITILQLQFRVRGFPWKFTCPDLARTTSGYSNSIGLRVNNNGATF